MANEHLKPRTSLIHSGEIAPDFVIPDQDKQEWRLSDALKKGDVVLSFVPFAFTGTCGTEMGCLSREMHDTRGRGITFVGVSCDSWAALKAWSKQEGYDIPLLSDLHRTVCKAYGLYWTDLNVSQRGTVIVGKDGKVRWSQARQPGNAFKKEEVEAALR